MTISFIRSNDESDGIVHLSKMPQHATLILLKAMTEAREWWSDYEDDEGIETARQFDEICSILENMVKLSWGVPNAIPQITWIKTQQTQTE